jgi:hydroxymethylbilane synthase
VGTGSPRRVAQLRAHRPDLTFLPIRGNVDTRLSRIADGTVDAVVLAVAGLRRIGRADAIGEALPIDVCTPAPAQGALAVECRDDLRGTDLARALAELDDAGSRAAATAERRLLAVLEAGCTAPVGAYGRLHGEEITITAAATDPGGTVIRLSDNGPAGAADALGEALARRLLAAGAASPVGETVP